MSFFDIFTPKGSQSSAPASQPGTPPAPNVANPGSVPLPASASQNPNVPGSPAAPVPSTVPTTDPNAPAASPMDQFANFWKNDPKANPSEPNFSIDPAKISEVAGTLDFSRAISPEVLQKIAAGGEDAISATLAAMNAIGQQSFAQSAIASAKMQEVALQRERENWAKQLPTFMRQHNSAETLGATNPVYNHPAAAPVVNMIRQQAIAANPQASSREIADMVDSYMKQLGSAFNPTASSVQSGKPSSGETDWGTFLP